MKYTYPCYECGRSLSGVPDCVTEIKGTLYDICKECFAKAAIMAYFQHQDIN